MSETSQEYFDCDVTVELPFSISDLIVDITVDNPPPPEPPDHTDDTLLEQTIFCDATIYKEYSNNILADLELVPAAMYYIMVDCTVRGELAVDFMMLVDLQTDNDYVINCSCVVGGESTQTILCNCRIQSTVIGEIEASCEVEELVRLKSYAYIM